MRMIDAATVHRLLDWPGVIEALRQGHCRPAPKAARATVDQPREGGLPDILMAQPAWQRGEALGVKIVTSFPENVPLHGVPTVDALYLTFSPETGKPLAVIDGEALIFRKTAADSALGASFLAPARAERLLMIGAGALAPYVIDAMLAVRPSLRQLLIWNRTAHRAEALAARLRDEGHDAAAVSGIDESLPCADVVVAATMSETPLVRGGALKPGAHVNLIGSFTPQMREGDDELLRRARIFVDDYGCLDRSGEFVGPLARGVIARDAVLADLFRLCQQGVPAGGMRETVTLFKNGGAGHLDLFVASHLMKRVDGDGTTERRPLPSRQA